MPLSGRNAATLDAGTVPAPTASRLAAGVALACFLAIALLFLLSLARLLAVPLWVDGQLPAGWSAQSAAALVVLSVCVLGLLGASLYCRVNTRLDADGVLLPTLRGTARVRWSEIERVSGRGLHVKLHAPGRVVTINPLCYTRPASVVPFLASRLSARALAGSPGGTP